MKPGRKLVELGAAACSDAEILAILIGSGGRHYSAMDTANQLIEQYGTLAALMDKPLLDLTTIRGIKATRAVRISAAYELARRLIRHLESER